MKRIAARHVLVLGSLFLGLTACGGPPPTPTFADIRFTNQAPINLDVARVDFVEEYRPNLQPPHIEEKLPVPLSRAVSNWVHDRLHAVGTKGRAVATVIDASVLEIPVPKEGGLTGTFTKQVDTRYEANVGIRVDINDDHGFTVRTATARAHRTQTTVEGITLDERDRTLYRMETELMADLDRQLEHEIRGNFGYYVK